jgi:hypothetical protein
MSLQVLAYNMKRVIAILGAGPLIATIRGKARLLCGTGGQVLPDLRCVLTQPPARMDAHDNTRTEAPPRLEDGALIGILHMNVASNGVWNVRERAYGLFSKNVVDYPPFPPVSIKGQ